MSGFRILHTFPFSDPLAVDWMGVTDSSHVKSSPLRPRDNPPEADVVIKPEEDSAQQLDDGFGRYLGIGFRLIFVG